MEFKEIEAKWQKKWEENKTFRAHNDSKKPKFYCLEMFPYPSGAGLHMGHALNYTIGDIYARFKRMNGFNVLYPMGYDAFGLPAENAAIKVGEHPKSYTQKAMANFVKQQETLGLSYDWSRKVVTCEPEYYKWNQYFFIKFYEKGLVYKKNSPANWCPKCNSVLANEQVHDGKCWVHKDVEVEIKHLEQWFIKTTKYAEELLEDIPKLQWPERIKLMQENWIGKSFGTLVDFKLKGTNETLQVFTTRPDTLYGVTFMVYAPEHPKVQELIKGTSYEKKVTAFIKKVVIEDKFTRADKSKEKEGMFIGRHAINPLTNEEIPIYVANFVLMDYGTGLVMAVPTHDQRDFEFAKKFEIPLKVVIQPEGKELREELMEEAYVDEGILVHSGPFNGLKNLEAIEKINSYLEEKRIGKKTVQYKLRDWLISRQRYWGTPIPMIYCEKCGVVPVPEKNLPVILPEDVKFGSGNPLESNEEFVNTTCPKCNGKARRETDTMDTFFDSSWYFLRYCDNKNEKEPFDKNKAKYWMPVNQYIGGAEHACMHLIYARFFTKALRDMNFLDFDEPFVNLFNQGMLHGSDGNKMSKSLGNVINPIESIEKYSADSLRLALMSFASPDKDTIWDEKVLIGSFKFLNKIYEYFDTVKIIEFADKRTESKLNKAIKEITEQIENFKYNMAIIKMREFFNNLPERTSKDVLEKSIKLLHPFCPHITEELWEKIGNEGFISLQKWPHYDETKIDEEAEFAEAFISNTISDIRAVLELTKIQKPQKITLFVSEQWKYDFFKLFRDLLEETRNEGEIIKRTIANVEFKKHAQDIVKLIPKLIKDLSKVPSVILEQEKEILALNEAKETLEKEFEAYLELIKAEDSKESKAKNAMPGKVAILIN